MKIKMCLLETRNGNERAWSFNEVYNDMYYTLYSDCEFDLPKGFTLEKHDGITEIVADNGYRCFIWYAWRNGSALMLQYHDITKSGTEFYRNKVIKPISIND